MVIKEDKNGFLYEVHSNNIFVNLLSKKNDENTKQDNIKNVTKHDTNRVTINDERLDEIITNYKQRKTKTNDDTDNDTISGIENGNKMPPGIPSKMASQYHNHNKNYNKYHNTNHNTTKRNHTAFDDELMQNMNTTDILITDTTYTPPGTIPDNNHFRRDILSNMTNIKYDPQKEKAKYKYEQVLKQRSTRNNRRK